MGYTRTNERHMDFGKVALNAATFGGIALGVGLALGTFSGLYKEHALKTNKTAIKMKMTPAVYEDPALREPLLVFAGVPKARIDALKRVVGRCDALMNIYYRVQTADPASIRLGVITEVSQIRDSILRYLVDFYRASHVLLLQQEGDLVPVSSEVANAHRAFVSYMDALVHNLALAIQSKYVEGIASRT